MNLSRQGRGLEAQFMVASRHVVDAREMFAKLHTEARTDSERYNLEKAFLDALPRLYGRVDEILDSYNDLKGMLT